eukprot:scaffold37673_cov136-Skeletonema_marinoi.AAC.2
MKVATLLILLPATAADSQSVNQARSNNPNLRGGGAVRKQSHRHEGHSLLEEFRQQRAHKKDIEDDTADDVTEQVVAGAGELIVGPGKYSDPVDTHHEKSLARNNKAHPAVFRTSRLSRGEMEKRANEMETKLQQVEEGTLQLNEKIVDRYKKFVDRYNELEKEIHLMNHPEEKEAEDENTTNIGDAAEEEEKSTSAYSSGKAEYEKSIEQMKEKKEHDVLMKVMEGDGEGKVTEKATSAEKKAEYVYAADGTKQLRVMDDDEINQLDKPDESGNKGGEDNLEAVSTGGESSTAEDDDIPPNFEGLSEGKMTNTAEWASKEEIGSKGGDDNLETVSKGGESSTAEDDDIPPNFEGLSEGKMTNNAEKSSRTEVVSKEGDDNLETVTVGGESSTAEDDDIPPNFEGLSEGKMTTNTSEKAPKEEIVGSEETSDAAEDDDIPPNFEGLGGGKDSLVVSEGATAEEEPEASVVATRQRGDDKIPADISVEDSLEKVKKVADVVNTPEEVSKKSIENVKTVQTDEKDDTEEAPLADGKADATPLKEEGDDGSDDAGTEEMDKALLPKTSEGLKSSERAMNVDGEER